MLLHRHHQKGSLMSPGERKHRPGSPVGGVLSTSGTYYQRSAMLIGSAAAYPSIRATVALVEWPGSSSASTTLPPQPVTCSTPTTVSMV